MANLTPLSKPLIAMTHSNAVESQNNDFTKDWFLELFRAAQSGLDSFDFPELDLDLDNSRNIENLDISADVLKDPSLDDKTIRLSNEDISFNSLDLESPLPKRSRVRLLEVIETPLRPKNTLLRGKLPPKSPKQSNLRQVIDYFAISPAAQLPQKTKASTESRNIVSADYLTEEDWEYLFQICSFLDEQKAEDISRASSYNMQDGRSAAHALNLSEPSGKSLQLLVEMGLELYKYRDEEMPWSAALAAKEHEAFAHEHQHFLSQRHEENLIRAAQIFKTNVFSEFFGHFKAAIHDYRRGPQQILYHYDFLRLRPVYYRLWHNQKSQVSSLEALSKRISLQNRQIGLLRNLRSSLKKVSQRSAECESNFKNNRLRQILNLWHYQTKALGDMRNSAAVHGKVMISKRHFLVWFNKLRTLRAQSILKKLFFRTLSAAYRCQREAKNMAPTKRLRRVLLYWRRRTCELSTNYFKEIHCRGIVDKKTEITLIKAWRRQARATVAVNKIRRVTGAKYLRQMRLQLALSQYLRYDRRKLAHRILNCWNSKYTDVRKLQSHYRELQTFELIAIKRLTLHLLQREFWRLEREVHNKVTNCCKFVLGAIFLRGLSLFKSENQSKTALSQKIGRRFLLARFLEVLILVSEEKKSLRLANAFAQCEERVRVKKKKCLFRYWRVKSEMSKYSLGQVGLWYRNNCMKFTIHRWREATKNTVSILEHALVLRSKLLIQNAFTRWNDLSNLIDNLAELANDYNTSLLASVFKVKLRRWLQHASSVSFCHSQANKIHEGRIRSVALSKVQDWHDIVISNFQDSIPFNTSLISSRSSWSQAQDLRQATPGKRPPMSPNRLQKWKTQNKAFSSNRLRQSDRSRVLPISRSPIVMEDRHQVVQRSNASTPTRPFRAGRNDAIIPLPTKQM